MDDWTYPHSNADVDLPCSQPMLLDEVWGAVEERLRVARAEAAAQAEVDRVAAGEEQARIWDCLDDGRSIVDVPLPFATPPGAAITF